MAGQGTWGGGHSSARLERDETSGANCQHTVEGIKWDFAHQDRVGEGSF